MSANKVPGNTKSSVSRRIMNVFLSLVLVLGLAPSLAFATPTDEATSQASNAYALEGGESLLSSLEAEGDTDNAAGEASGNEATTVVYKQSDGYEPYQGWQGNPWPDSTQSSTGGTTRKGWPAVSLVSPLSKGVTTYENDQIVTGTGDVTVVTDMNATNDTNPAWATRADGWYFKNIILPSYDISSGSISFTITGVAPGGYTAGNSPQYIGIATSDDPTTWGTYGEEGSTLVWQATSSDITTSAAQSNWWKVLTITASTTNLKANETYYFVLRDDMPIGNVTSYCDVVFEFSTNTSRTASWDGDLTNAGYGREQGNGSIKMGFLDPAPRTITTDLTKIESCFYNKATQAIQIRDDGKLGISVHSDGSGSNWITLDGWNDTNGQAITNIKFYDQKPVDSTGAYSVEGLTPVASSADGNIAVEAVNPERAFYGRDGVIITADGLQANKTYYMVIEENFKWNNGQGVLAKPLVLEFTAAQDLKVSMNSTAKDLQVGDTFTASVNTNKATSALQGTFEYSENLKLVSISAGDGLSIPENEGAFESAVSTALFTFFGNTASKGGTVATATFECVKPGEASVSLKNVVAGTSLDTEDLNVEVSDTVKETVLPKHLTGDVNNSAHLNIVDAQLAYDMSVSKYAEGSESRAALLALWGEGVTYAMVETIADVNGGGLDSTDAFAIQYAVHHNGVFAESE